MAKKLKMKTPDWILEGYDSPEAYNKVKGITGEKKSKKTFKIRKCPKCGSDGVKVVVGKEAAGEWECKKCGWNGVDIKIDELSEEEFMKYLDDKGEEVA